MYSGRRPTRFISWATRSCSSLLDIGLNSMAGSEMISRTVMRGFREENGSWKTIWISLRKGLISLLEAVARSMLEPLRAV